MKLAGNSDTFSSKEEVAAYWAMRLSSPDCHSSDRAACKSWCDESPENLKLFERAKTALGLLDAHAMHPDLYDMAQKEVRDTRPRRNLVRHLAAACAAALAVGLSAVLLRFPSPESENVIVAAASEVFETRLGERSVFSLKDGTVVTLNTESRIEVDMSGVERSVTLTTGQALFEVARDTERPFVVTAGTRRITALGTAFDVRLEEDDSVKVVLVEGRVAIDKLELSESDGVPNVIASDSSRVELTAGQSLVSSNDEAPLVSAVDIETETSWRDGRLVFRSTPISEVAREFNRYNDVALRISDQSEFDNLIISGVFTTNRLDRFVSLMETTHPIIGQRTREDEVTLVWKD